jgi:hypothetical protein
MMSPMRLAPLVVLSVLFTPRLCLADPPTFASWSVQRPENEGLVVEFPTPPRVERTERRDPAGGRVSNVVMSCAITLGAPMEFTLYVSKAEEGFGGSLLGRFDEVLESFIEGSEDVEVRRARPLVEQGFPGAELELVLVASRRVLLLRQFIGRSRIYMFGVVAPEVSVAATRVDAERFFRSARFAPADAPIPNGTGRFDLNAWATIDPADADFVASIPGSVRVRSVTVHRDDFLPIVRQYFVERSETGQRIEVAVSRFRDGPVDGAIDRLREARRAAGFSVTEETFSHRQGYAARSIRYRSATEVVHVLYVITMGRLYEASVTTSATDEATMRPHINRFFQSLRVL